MLHVVKETLLPSEHISTIALWGALQDDITAKMQTVYSKNKYKTTQAMQLLKLWREI